MTTVEISSSQLSQHTGTAVRIHGHIQSLRDMGNLAFVVIRDMSGSVQLVADEQEVLTVVRQATCETPVIAEGVVVAKPNGQGFEIHLKELTLLSTPAPSLPVEIGKQSKVDGLALSTMLDYRPLTLRSPKVRAIFKIEAVFCEAFREFLRERQFTEIHSPKIVATGTEGGAQLFKLNYFGREAFLAQSPQFYKQIMVGALERVFEIAPVYRAEEHDTTRHLNEYISMDVEMGFIESERDLTDLLNKLVRHMFEKVSQSCAEELSLFGAKVPEVAVIPAVTLAEAVDIINSYKEKGSAEKTDLDPEGEKIICEHFLKRENTDLVFITGYPLSVRPFYAMPLPAEGEMSSRSFDLLFRGLEITTGGQRIHRHEELVAAMEGRGLDPEAFKDYLQCFQFGMPPHGGFAIGLERIAKQLLGLPSVKLAALFPRDINRMTP
ncbi:MAG: aspartate--tRNA(Asn) ligase [Candidatus Melainabacteria bacterium]|nr:aspartate--tRNA(Asn) ligase [Candidatus Melainabacteria bacterium]